MCHWLVTIEIAETSHLLVGGVWYGWRMSAHASLYGGVCASPSFPDIALPREVIRQLKLLLDVPIERLTPWQVHAAHVGYISDGEVFDDPNGYSFEDMLILEREELEKSACYLLD